MFISDGAPTAIQVRSCGHLGFQTSFYIINQTNRRLCGAHVACRRACCHDCCHCCCISCAHAYYTLPRLLPPYCTSGASSRPMQLLRTHQLRLEGAAGSGGQPRAPTGSLRATGWIRKHPAVCSTAAVARAALQMHTERAKRPALESDGRAVLSVR